MEIITNDDLSASTVRIGSDSESSSHKSEEFEELQKLVDTEYSNGSNSQHSSEEVILPDTVTVLKYKDTETKIYLVGTAHFSMESINDVIKVIEAVHPSVIVLELCRSRINILKYDEETLLEETKNIDFDKIKSTIRTNGLYNGLMYLLLLNMSAYITREIGMAPGGEFRAAVREAEKLEKCVIQLGDRPIEITMKRAFSKLSWFQTIKLGWNLLTCKEPINKEEIERCKSEDILQQLLTQLAGEYPTLGEVFVNERNIFLTNSLQSIAFHESTTKEAPSKIVGVVGIGHVAGIKELWDVDQSPYIAATMYIPPPSLSSKIFKVTFRISVFTLGGYLVYRYVPIPNIIKTTCATTAETVVSKIKTLL